MTDFTIKQGDTLPPLEATLLAPGGAVLSLVGATVTLNMKLADCGVVVIHHGAVEIVEAAAGRVRYAWGDDDTARADEYEFEFEVDYGGGQVQRVPNTGHKTLAIIRHVA